MKVNLLMEFVKGQENVCLLMDGNIKVNGEIIKCMDKAV